METRAVLIFSGGMDSATLLYDLMNQGIRPICIGFNYGQRHGKELEAAKHLCSMIGIEYKIISLADVVPLLKGSSQTDPSVPVPEGHYAQENMKLTVVPNRNMIMLSIAIAAAIGEKIPVVYYGAHAGDHDIYPDCRQSFVDAMKAAAALCDWTPVTIEAPYLNMTKGDICKKGMLLSVPYESTWTCYVGGERPCGKCGSCTERLEAFDFAGATDPLIYATEVK